MSHHEESTVGRPLFIAIISGRHARLAECHAERSVTGAGVVNISAFSDGHGSASGLTYANPISISALMYLAVTYVKGSLTESPVSRESVERAEERGLLA